MTDAAINQRVQHQRDRIEMLNRQLQEPFLTPKERGYFVNERERAQRRIAMLLEDGRRPTFAKPAEFGKADDYAAWRKEQGL